MRIANLTRVRIAMASPMQSEARVFGALLKAIKVFSIMYFAQIVCRCFSKIEKYFSKKVILFLIYLGIYFLADKGNYLESTILPLL